MCDRTIVVVNAGSPVAMPWLDEVEAVIYTWFPGQEMGDALVDVLLGDVEPQGRLPVTFPISLEDTPAFEHHPGRNGVANYLEGRLIGYRWYDTVGRPPLFPFGFGLGYARGHDRQRHAPRATRRNRRRSKSISRNASDRDGLQVVQVYAARTGPSERRGDEPVQQLVGFAKIAVPGGGTSSVTVPIDPRAMHTWSVAEHDWVRAEGPFELRVGTSSADIAVRLPVES